MKETFKPLHLPCGGIAYFDHESGISYRCGTCFAVVGSVGQPKSCHDEIEKWNAFEILGGRGWDYDLGQPE